MNGKYDAIKLNNQLCFPLYAVSNLITRKYKPLLDKLDLTYTQYIVMMVLWEKKQVNEKYLCDALYLKSNTLTPLLRKLQEKNYIKKAKSSSDERNLVITLTESGESLKDQAICVPDAMSREISLTPEESTFLYQTLYKILNQEKIKNEKD